MAEGLFAPECCPIPQLPPCRLRAAMVRILPRTQLCLDLADTPELAREMARNEVLPDGTERWHRFFTRSDLELVNDPAFTMGMVRHEFAALVRAGATFPAITPLLGGGSGFAINAQGDILTNYHLVTGEVAFHHRTAGAIGEPVPCRGLRAEVAHREPDGGWTWRPAERLWLVSNPPQDRAIHQRSDGTAVLREDTALLRVEPAPAEWLPLSARHTRELQLGERLWMAGFPLRSARSAEAREAAGYADADGTLRVSTGTLSAIDGDDALTADVDGSMGNSGSPVIDGSGEVVGLFSRAVGDGPRSAFEYGAVQRVLVPMSRVRSGLNLRQKS